MKSLPLVATLLIGVFLPSSIRREPLIVSINSDLYGPYVATNLEQPILSFRITVNQDLDNAIELIQGYNEGERYVCWWTRSDYHQIKKNEEFVSNLLFPSHEALRSTGTKFNFVIRSNDKDVFITSFYLYGYKPRTIDPTNYTNSSYLIPPKRFKFLNGNAYTYTNSFSFGDFTNYFTFDSYYRLLLDQYRFKYSGTEPLTYKDAYLIMPDPVPCFSGLIDKTDKEIRIPLNLCLNENNEFYLQFANKFYVNKKNLQMSIRKESGYSSTKYIYFPINKKEEVVKQRFLFEINEFGEDKTSLKWEAKLLDIPYLVGDCSHSEYCLVGGVK